MAGRHDVGRVMVGAALLGQVPETVRKINDAVGGISKAKTEIERKAGEVQSLYVDFSNYFSSAKEKANQAYDYVFPMQPAPTSPAPVGPPPAIMTGTPIPSSMRDDDWPIYDDNDWPESNINSIQLTKAPSAGATSKEVPFKQSKYISRPYPGNKRPKTFKYPIEFGIAGKDSYGNMSYRTTYRKKYRSEGKRNIRRYGGKFDKLYRRRGRRTGSNQLIVEKKYQDDYGTLQPYVNGFSYSGSKKTLVHVCGIGQGTGVSQRVGSSYTIRSLMLRLNVGGVYNRKAQDTIVTATGGYITQIPQNVRILLVYWKANRGEDKTTSTNTFLSQILQYGGTATGILSPNKIEAANDFRIMFDKVYPMGGNAKGSVLVDGAPHFNDSSHVVPPITYTDSVYLNKLNLTVKCNGTGTNASDIDYGALYLCAISDIEVGPSLSSMEQVFPQIFYQFRVRYTDL